MRSEYEKDLTKVMLRNAQLKSKINQIKEQNALLESVNMDIEQMDSAYAKDSQFNSDIESISDIPSNAFKK